MLSLAAYLDQIVPYLGPALASPDHVTAMSEAAVTLPLLSRIGFEARLDCRAPGLDFFAAASRETDGEALGRWLDRHPGGPLASWADGRIAEFCRRWAGPGSPATHDYDGVSQLWLEFDTASGAGAAGPNVLFTLKGQLGPKQQGALGRAAFALLTGQGMPASTLQSIDRCLQTGAGWLYQIGFMLARPLTAVRLILAGLPLDSIPAYLQVVGWPGPVDEVNGIISLLGRFPSHIVLNLDIGEDILPRAGVECYVRSPRLPPLAPVWRDLLDALVARDLCAPQQRDALLAWPGQSGADFFGPMMFIRLLNHLKLTHELDGSWSAKGYFGCLPLRAPS